MTSFRNSTSSTNTTQEKDEEEVKPLEFGDIERNERSTSPNEDELSRYESNVTAARTLSRRMTGAEELIKEATNITEPLPPMGGGRDYPPMVPNRERYLVSFDGPDDPLHPHNFPLKKKLLYASVVGMCAMGISLGSAMFSAAAPVVDKEYGVGNEVGILGTSFFVFGFASGPIIWGPLTELYGRKPILIISGVMYSCFSFACGSSKDIQSVLITRFFSGFVGSSSLVASPAVLADLFGAATRGRATAIFAIVLFGGPMLAPIFSAFIVKNPHLGWRWTLFFTGIVAILGLLGTILFLEETHHPMILVKKAETLRRRTGNWGIAAPHEEVSLDFKEIVEKNLTRPIRMLCTEPILLLMTIYNAFIYGLLYLFLTAIPLIFGGNYHFVSGVAELPYLAMLIGIFFGGAICIYSEERFKRIMDANGGKPIPEERLPPMMIGSFLFSGGLFWLGWAGSFPDRIHWIVPSIGASFIGAGLISIFLPCLNYIIDCYLVFAASALAGNTLLRSAFGGVFPLFALQMFEKMQIKWAATLLGAFGACLIPVPFLFYKYGKKIRLKSKYASGL